MPTGSAAASTWTPPAGTPTPTTPRTLRPVADAVWSSRVLRRPLPPLARTHRRGAPSGAVRTGAQGGPLVRRRRARTSYLPRRPDPRTRHRRRRVLPPRRLRPVRLLGGVPARLPRTAAARARRWCDWPRGRHSPARRGRRYGTTAVRTRTAGHAPRSPSSRSTHAHAEFLRLGTGIEVLAPGELRSRIARTVAELAERYGNSRGPGDD